MSAVLREVVCPECGRTRTCKLNASQKVSRCRECAGTAATFVPIGRERAEQIMRDYAADIRLWRTTEHTLERKRRAA